ncbi:YfdX family protein [uncultured Nitrosomonas sp.]|uniref:YfdX family protein n=1 Tax=uncultured Nitrosomonas sp. TaxID=156424 RepID=UPI00260C6258|nr:YfdX family protein [uncultured Nitrosomonas sp.]
MDMYSKFTAAAFSGLISLSAIAPLPAFADSHPAQKDAVAKVSEKARDEAIIKTADDAFHSLRAVQAARLAIFNGSIDEAVKLVSEAKTDMLKTKDDAKNFEIMTHKTANSGDVYVPFDTSMTLAEGFKPTTEKQASINKANQHLAKGEHKHAVEVLKAANIDVTVVAAMIPVNASLQHINDAGMLINEKKFYEANLVLKAVQDSVIIDAYSIDAIPKQGKKH